MDPRFPTARKFAERIVAQLGLTPPVPIEDVVHQYADIFEGSFGSRTDAFVLIDAARPRVFLNKGKPTSTARRRFTLAHELGHIRIVWHIGLATCHVGVGGEGGDRWVGGSYRRGELEADSFASEILMPSNWLTSFCDSNSFGYSVAEIASKADVSVPAAAIALSHKTDNPLSWAIYDNGKLKWMGRSPSCGFPQPFESKIKLLNQEARFRKSVNIGDREIRWWEFDNPGPIETGSVPTPKAAMAALCDILSVSDVDPAPIRSSLNGIVGSANNQGAIQTPESMRDFIFHRIKQNPRLVSALDIPELAVWVEAMALQIRT